MPGYDRAAQSPLRVRIAGQKLNTDTPFVVGSGLLYSPAGNTLSILLDEPSGLEESSDGLTVKVDPITGNVLQLTAAGLKVTGVVLLTGPQTIAGIKTFSSNVLLNQNLKLQVAGGGIFIKEGTNATMGAATLVTGAAVVSTTAVTASSRIFLMVQSLGTVVAPKAVAVTARTAGTSFTITSADATDTSVVGWLIVEPTT